MISDVPFFGTDSESDNSESDDSTESTATETTLQKHQISTFPPYHFLKVQTRSNTYIIIRT